MRQEKENAAGESGAYKPIAGGNISYNSTAYRASQDAVQAFMDTMWSAGLGCGKPVITDGNIHRFHVTGDKKGSLNGWYVFFTEGKPAGVFGSWKTGQRETWSENGRRLSEGERDALSKQIYKARALALKEKRLADEKAAQEANYLWGNAAPVVFSHPYLKAKKVKSHNLWQSGNVLLVPLFDIHGKLWNVQRIYPNGKKLFCSGRAKGLFSPIGEITNPAKLIVCEGWATGATLYEQTGVSVLCAMNAGNLLQVAKESRKHWPDTDFIIAADNDRQTEGNPGLTKAREAALSIGAKLAVPEFPEGSKGTDFNDLALLQKGRAQL